MRVLQLCKFFPPVPGGMETVVFELAEGLTRRGVDIEVICASTDGTTRHDRGPAGYPVTRGGSWGTVMATSMSPAVLAAWRRAREDVDIVHLHLPDPLGGMVLLVAPPKPGTRLVLHWHSDVVRQRGLGRRMYARLEEWLLARADAVIATSPPYAASSPALRRWAAKTTVIPIGIGDNPQPAAPGAVEALRRRFGGRTIVFSLGRMSAYKGFDVLIDAAAQLPSGIVVAVGGAGELLERHRRHVVAKGFAGKIEFVGGIDEHELPAWYDACSVFCLPSTLRSEAFGVAILEAMARGKPIVATDVPGSGVPFVNVDGETGLNVAPGDASALAAAIVAAIGDRPLAGRLGVAARRRFESCFRAEAMLDATLALYRRLPA